MAVAFTIAAIVAVVATVRVISNTRAVHALLYLVVSLLAVSVVFYTLGAPFAAALEALVYAGAIMVLFVFVVMMLNLGEAAARRERHWLAPRLWVGPGVLALVLLVELVALLWPAVPVTTIGGEIGPRAVGMLLFGPYLLAVELASMLLLAALVAAHHLARRVDITVDPEQESPEKESGE
jgi:NADH-quinone oxidoreductase subunit J